MVCQVFESVPGTLAIHEPDPPTNVHFLNRSNKLHVNEYNVVLKSMLRIMCTPRQGITRICIKPRPQCPGMITNISKLGLDIKQVFIYRNSLDTLISWLAVMSYDPFLVCVRLCTDAVWFSNILPCMRNIFVLLCSTPERNIEFASKCDNSVCSCLQLGEPSTNRTWCTIK